MINTLTILSVKDNSSLKYIKVYKQMKSFSKRGETPSSNALRLASTYYGESTSIDKAAQ